MVTRKRVNARRRAEMESVCARMADAGASCKAIAYELGMSYSFTNNMLRKYRRGKEGKDRVTIGFYREISFTKDAFAVILEYARKHGITESTAAAFVLERASADAIRSVFRSPAPRD